MNTQKLLELLSQIETQLKNHAELGQAKKSRLLEKLAMIKQSYETLEIRENMEDLFNSLVKRGSELLKELRKNPNTKEISKMAAYYFRYLEASTFDFRGNIKGINHFTRFFLITAALFMALTPQFYGFVLPIFFILPIYTGLKGVRRRSFTGLLMTLAIVPMALMTSITWLRYLLQVALPDFGQAVATTAQGWHVSPGVAQLLIIGPSILSFVLLASASVTVYLGYKYNKMFV